MSTAPVVDAIVLAGGEGRRLGGVDKAAVVVGGRSMLEHVLDAVADARRSVVVGPPSLETHGAARVQEDPPLGGPAAGLAAGLAHLGAAEVDPADVVVVLACDLPLAASVVPELLTALARDGGSDGVVLLDGEGRRQPLLACYRGPALRAAVARLDAEGGVDGASMRRLIEQMTLVELPDPTGAARDGDTWDAVARLDEILTGKDHMSPDPSALAGATPSPGHEPAGHDLDAWVALLAEEFGVDPTAVDVQAILDLARETAHGVARPAVPLTGFFVGYAVATGSKDRAELDRVTGRVTALAQAWSARREAWAGE